MVITVTDPGPAQVMELSGDLDRKSVPELRNRLDSLLQKAGPKARLVLDLSGVDYISATGIQTLFYLAQEINRLDGRLILCGLGPYAAHALESVCLTDLVPLSPDRESALREF